MDKYVLRRQILEAIKEAEPAAVEVDDVYESPQMLMAAVPRDTIAEELRGLASHGYLTDLRPGREPLYRLTPAGADQASMESDLDEYLWGQYASKFAGKG